MDFETHIHCAHNNSRPSSNSPRKQLRVHLTSRKYQHIIYHNNNNNNDNNGTLLLLVSRLQYPCSRVTIYTNPINPFCSQCRSDIVAILFKQGFRDLEPLKNEYRCLAYQVHRQLVSMVDSAADQNIVLLNYQLRRKAPARVCDEEEYMRLVAEGEVFDEVEVPVEEGPVPASESAIERLERVVDDEIVDKKDDCAICLEGLKVMKKQESDYEYMEAGNDEEEEDDLINKFTILRLPCKHVFHGDCVIKWLRKNHVCPCCRFELPVDS